MPGRTWSAELTVVGMNFRCDEQSRKTLSRKCPFTVELEREPDNRSDENAIRVIVAKDSKKLMVMRGTHIGYLRRNVAALFAPRLDDGSIEATALVVTEVNVLDSHATIEGRFRDKPLKSSQKRKSSKRA